MKGNVMLKATEPSEGVVERRFDAQSNGAPRRGSLKENSKIAIEGVVERKYEFSTPPTPPTPATSPTPPHGGGKHMYSKTCHGWE